MPVWADTFGNEVEKSTWLTYLLISNPLGVVLGYALCATLIENIGWRWAFYIQSACLLPCLLSLVCTPIRYLDIKSMTREVRRLNSSFRSSANSAPKASDSAPKIVSKD